MTPDKYIKLTFGKKNGNSSVDITEFFAPYTYEGLIKEKQGKVSSSNKRVNSKRVSFGVSNEILKSFNINANSELNSVDCYHQEPLNENDWRSSPDNTSYTSIFDYWSEAHVVSTMVDPGFFNHNISEVVRQELISKIFISELKKDLSILLRFDNDINAWNSNDFRSANFPINKLPQLVDAIKLFFVKVERKRTKQFSSNIEKFLKNLDAIYGGNLPKQVEKIKRACNRNNLLPFQIKSKIISILKKDLGINFNESAFMTRKKYFFKLDKKYNLTKYSMEDYREFAYFPEKLLARLNDLIVDLRYQLRDFNKDSNFYKFQNYFKDIPEDKLGGYYDKNRGCFAIMKTENRGYFALSGWYDCHHNNNNIINEPNWEPFDAMQNLANDINSKVFSNSYIWSPLTDDVLTYYSHKDLDKFKLETAKPLDSPKTLSQCIKEFPKGWSDVIANPTYRLFSCCEKKLLAQIDDQICDQKCTSLKFFIRYTPCHLCMAPMKETANKVLINVYSLADNYPDLNKPIKNRNIIKNGNIIKLKDVTYKVLNYNSSGNRSESVEK